MEFGLIGGGWQDYHDKQIKPLLDQIDQQMRDVLVSGVHGDIAQMQARDDLLGDGVHSQRGMGQKASDPELASLSNRSNGQVLQASFPLGNQNASLMNGTSDDLDLRPAHLTLGQIAPASRTPDSAALLGAAAYPHATDLQKAGTPDTAIYSPLTIDTANAAQNSGNYGSYLPPPTGAARALPDKALGYHASDALNAQLGQQKILGTTYPDFKAALGTWADAAQPFQKTFSTELNSNIYAVPGGWQIGRAFSNGSHCSDGGLCSTSPVAGEDVPSGLYMGYIHTHPTNFGGLDQADQSAGYQFNNGQSDGYHGSAYVSLPNGQINGWMAGMQLTDDSKPGSGQFMIRPPRGKPGGFQ